MASTTASRIVPASPERAWQLIGGFGSLPDWLPNIRSSTLDEGGRVRKLLTRDGETIVERLIAFNDVERHYSYTIVQAPFPVTEYLATLRVHTVARDAGISEVQWSGRFTPRDVPESDVVAHFTGLYSNGLDALHAALS
ncbi:XoxI [Streptomyces sp. AS58]|uniref:SRPBCC family protein n=1 Tax=Streptomyces cadmiisoli TaxID=2184053 RepID=A0A2Z4ITL7_9ACTN|nr:MULTISPECIES: SRPBCC family protein [Streptomyces]AWW35886.1 SRPBCC family protein [Streptomyces cadmiisoli]KOV70691.1 XoxI [Streptomyces sp. AS58]